MHHLPRMADQGEHQKHGFDQHPVVPCPARAEFEVGRIACSGMKPGIGQDHPAILELLNERMKPGIVNVGRCAEPSHSSTPRVDPQTELAAHDPAVIG